MDDGRIRRNDRVVFRRLEAGSGAVLLHLDSGAYRQVNETGALIWSLLEPAPTRDELVAAIRAAVPEAPATVEDDVDRFLASLSERGLVVRDGVDTDTPLAGAS